MTKDIFYAIYCIRYKRCYFSVMPTEKLVFIFMGFYLKIVALFGGKKCPCRSKEFPIQKSLESFAYQSSQVSSHLSVRFNLC